MKRRLLATLALAMTGGAALAADGHLHHHGHTHHDTQHDGHTMLDSLRYTKFEMHELEWRDGDANHGALNWDGELFHGSDLQRFGISSRGERSGGSTHEADIELLYRRAIAPFWDIDIGWRHDLQPRPERDWLALGVHGEAPYGIDTEATVYVGDKGRVLLDLKLGYELLLTQRLSIEPKIELSAASTSDDDTESGNGLTGVEASLRLRYAVTRKFAPYIGVVREKRYGDTADFARAEGKDTERTQIIAGFKFWL